MRGEYLQWSIVMRRLTCSATRTTRHNGHRVTDSWRDGRCDGFQSHRVKLQFQFHFDIAVPPIRSSTQLSVFSSIHKPSHAHAHSLVYFPQLPTYPSFAPFFHRTVRISTHTSVHPSIIQPHPPAYVFADTLACVLIRCCGQSVRKKYAFILLQLYDCTSTCWTCATGDVEFSLVWDYSLHAWCGLVFVFLSNLVMAVRKFRRLWGLLGTTI
jgi:hypothetical protein